MPTTVANTLFRAKHRCASRCMRGWSAGLALVFLGGCTTLDNVRLEQQVRAQAEQRWHHMIKGDFEAAWAMHSGGWQAANPFVTWRSQFGADIVWTDAETVGSQCDSSPPDVCTVTVRISYRIKSLPYKDDSGTGEVKETWVHSDAGWRHVPGQVPVQ